MVETGWEKKDYVYPDDSGEFGGTMGANYLQSFADEYINPTLNPLIKKVKNATDVQKYLDSYKAKLIDMAVSAGMPRDKAEQIIAKAGGNLEKAYADMQVQLQNKAMNAIIGTPSTTNQSSNMNMPKFNFKAFKTGGIGLTNPDGRLNAMGYTVIGLGMTVLFGAVFYMMKPSSSNTPKQAVA